MNLNISFFFSTVFLVTKHAEMEEKCVLFLVNWLGVDRISFRKKNSFFCFWVHLQSNIL